MYTISMIHPVPKKHQRITFRFDEPYHFSFGTALAWLTGKRHKGTDFGMPIGTSLRAPEDCKVIQINTNPVVSSYGNYVMVESTDGRRRWLLAHLAGIAYPRVGKTWQAGQVFCWSGDTGSSSGPHTHLEYHERRNGKWELGDPVVALAGSQRPILDRVNEAIREAGDDPNRPVGTLNLSKWLQNHVVKTGKFTNDEAGYKALLGFIKYRQQKKAYPFDHQK